MAMVLDFAAKLVILVTMEVTTTHSGGGGGDGGNTGWKRDHMSTIFQYNSREHLDW